MALFLVWKREFLNLQKGTGRLASTTYSEFVDSAPNQALNVASTPLDGDRIMASAYRHEPLIPATPKTAALNLAILRTQAASKGRDFTPDQSAAAVRIAVQFDRVVREHAKKRTML
ncbi:MAG TPA: hypothetical protein VGF92_15890 [Stellaceae bacterium]